MNKIRFPPGGDAKRARRVLAHDEEQTGEEAVAEDEAALRDPVHYGLVESVVIRRAK